MAQPLTLARPFEPGLVDTKCLGQLPGLRLRQFLARGFGGAADAGGKFRGAVADEHAVREAGRAGVGTDPSAGERVRSDLAGVSKSSHG
jgi:hypothetical protein